jgi:hypothetical protein
VNATLSYSLLVFSSFLSQLNRKRNLISKWHLLTPLSILAICTHVAGSTLAIVNAIFIVIFSILKFTSAFTNCYCTGSVIQKGRDTFVPIFLGGTQIKQLVYRYWITGASFSSASFVLTLVFLVISKGDYLYKGSKTFKRIDSFDKDSEGGDLIREDDCHEDDTSELRMISASTTHDLESEFRETMEVELNVVVSEHDR